MQSLGVCALNNLLLSWSHADWASHFSTHRVYVIWTFLFLPWPHAYRVSCVFILLQCVCTWSVSLTRTTWSHADVVLLFSHSTQPVRAVNLGCWLDPMLTVLHVLARSQDVRAWNSLLYYWFDDMLTILHVFSRSQSVSACDSLLIWPFLMCFPVHRA